MLEDIISARIFLLGINFIPEMRRAAQENFLETLKNTIIKNLSGVFCDQSVDFILQISQEYSLEFIQLHGSENLEYISQLTKKVIKAVCLKSEKSLSLVDYYCGSVDTILLDAKKAGSGTKADEKLLHSAIEICRKLNQKYAIAGGINTQTAPQFLTDYPDAAFFDTASGIEDANGNYSPSALYSLTLCLS